MNTGEILIYQNQEGNIKIDVRLEEETVWLTQAQIALLFGKGRTTITEHITNVFKEGELDEKVVCRNFRLTTPVIRNLRISAKSPLLLKHRYYYFNWLQSKIATRNTV